MPFPPDDTHNYDSLAEDIPVAPTLSNDGQRLFVSTSSNHFYCLDSQTGQKKWQVPGASPFLTGARVSPDDQRVYIIQSIDGWLYAYDQPSGVLMWLTSCDSSQQHCSNPVKATFALSRTGEYLYYADVFGKVMALKLGHLVVESIDHPPTKSPGTFRPPLGSSQASSSTPIQTSSKSGPSLGGTVALVIVAMLLAIGSGFYAVLLRRDKIRFRSKGSSQRQSKKERDGDFSEPGPDPYEDSVISEHQRKSTGSQAIWLEETKKQGSFDSEEVPASLTSDKRSMLIGTSNRVAPLTEDFSLGAAVLV